MKQIAFVALVLLPFNALALSQTRTVADLPEIPAECASPNHCKKILSITTDIATGFGYSRNDVKSGVWIKYAESKIAQIIFHQPRNAPLHDVIEVGGAKAYTPNRDRVVLKDDDTEAMLKFNSGCHPGDFAAGSCTRFEMKLKTSTDGWTPVAIEIENGAMTLIEKTGRRATNTLYLKAYVDSVGLFGSETKAHFTTIRFEQK